MANKGSRMFSNRPYLVRAFYEWIVDNDCTPYVVVDAHYSDVEVPQSFVTNGQIILNISPRAVNDFEMNNDRIKLSTRFGGVPIDIYCPMGAILGIYAQENGQGMMFESEPSDEPPPPKGPRIVAPTVDKKQKEVGKIKPSLRVVK
jgi:stringent starvation protein B